MPGTHLFFASDFHLGVPDYASSRQREDCIVAWLDSIKADAKALYLLGDVFDFWFEYRTVVPKGYIRLLGKLAELSDSGIELYFFKGNHDMWMFDYFQKELNAQIIDHELEFHYGGKRFFLHHGDGLGPGDRKYKMLKKVFRSRICQWLFARLHPNLGIGIANYWSRNSRIASSGKEQFESEDKEWLVSYCKDKLQEQSYDYLIFGHRHLPLDIALPDGARYLNLGEWVYHQTYAQFDGQNLYLKKF